MNPIHRLQQLLLLAGALLVAATELEGQINLDELGNLDRLNFSGNETFTDRALIDALAGDIDVFFARRPDRSIIAYRNLLRAKLRDGYLEEGFPEVSIAVSGDDEGFDITIDEGPRFLARNIRIEAAGDVKGLDPDLLRAALLDPGAESDDILFHPADEAFEVGESQETGAPHRFRSTGLLKTDPEDGIWRPGQPAAFHSHWKLRAREALLQSLARQGFLDAEVAVRLERSEGYADCVVDLLDPGPVRTIRTVVVNGCKQQDPDAIVRFLGPLEGEPATLLTAMRARHRLYDSMRFLAVKVALESQNEKQADLVFNVVEWKEAPPIREETPKRTSLARDTARRINRIAASTEHTLVIRVEVGDSETPRWLELRLQGDRKLLARFGRDAGEGGQTIMVAEGYPLAAGSDDEPALLIAEELLSHKIFAFIRTRIANPDAEKPSAFSAGAGFGSRSDDGTGIRIDTDFSVEPMSLALLVHSLDCAVAETAEAFVFEHAGEEVSGNNFTLTVSSDRDSYFDLNVSVTGDGGTTRLDVRAEQMDLVLDYQPKPERGSPEAIDYEALSAWILMASRELATGLSVLLSGHDRFVAPDGGTIAAIEVIERIAGDLLPTALRYYFEPRQRGEHFHLPKQEVQASSEFMLSLALLFHHRFEHYFATDSWPMLLSRETIAVVANRADDTIEHLYRHIAGPDCSPLFFVSLVTLLELANPQMAKSFAQVGERYAGSRYFENDLAVFHRSLRMVESELEAESAMEIASLVYNEAQLEAFGALFDPDADHYWADSALMAAWEVSGKDTYLRFLRKKQSLGVARNLKD